MVETDGTQLREFVFEPEIHGPAARKTKVIDYVMTAYSLNSTDQSQRKSWCRTNFIMGQTYADVVDITGTVSILFHAQWSKVRFEKHLMMEMCRLLKGGQSMASFAGLTEIK